MSNPFHLVTNGSTESETIDPPGGGGDDGGMGPRITALEGVVAALSEQMNVIAPKVEHIDREVSNFKWWGLGAILTLVITLIGTALTVQQMTVTTFQAAAQQATPQPPQAQHQVQPIIIQIPAVPEKSEKAPPTR